MSTEDMREKRRSIWRVYPENVALAIEALGTTAVIAGLICVIYGLWTLPSIGDVYSPSRLKRIILALWIVLPPGWFAIEYHLLYKHFGVENTLQEFKYSQEVASKFWIAVSTVLSGLYVGPEVLNKLGH